MNTFGIIYLARDSVLTITWVFYSIFPYGPGGYLQMALLVEDR